MISTWIPRDETKSVAKCSVSRIATNPATQIHAKGQYQILCLRLLMPSVRPRTPVQILKRVGFPIKHRPSLINWFDFGKTLKRRSQTHFVAKNHLPKRKSHSGGDGIGYLHKNVTCLPSIFASIYFSCECDANLELCWWKTLSTAQQRDDWTAH